MLNTFSYLELIALAYLVLVGIKTLLIYTNMRVTVAAMHRRGGMSNITYGILFLIATPIIVALNLYRLLVAEKLRFFLVYDNRKAIRDILSTM